MSDQMTAATGSTFTIEDLQPTASYLLLQCVGDIDAALRTVRRTVKEVMTTSLRGTERTLLSHCTKGGVVNDDPFHHDGYVSHRVNPSPRLSRGDCVARSTR